MTALRVESRPLSCGAGTFDFGRFEPFAMSSGKDGFCAIRTAGVDVRERETRGTRGLGLFQGRGVPAFGEGADQRGNHQRPNVPPFCAEANLATAHVGVKPAERRRRDQQSADNLHDLH
jgi:hypothetical protein